MKKIVASIIVLGLGLSSALAAEGNQTKNQYSYQNQKKQEEQAKNQYNKQYQYQKEQSNNFSNSGMKNMSGSGMRMGGSGRHW